VETRATTSEALADQIAEITGALQELTTLLPIAFTDRMAEYNALWNIRKGLFPAVGAIRRIGTTVIIEDVAFPLRHLAAATLELQQLFKRHHYREAIIFGHALEGNLHFVFTQDFSDPAEIARYRGFMDDVCRMVVERYDGSLKAEHGTGRNMAPYVEMEWGAQAYALMKEIKSIFDPRNLLNPGVMLSGDPQSHIRNLKPLPPAHDLLDRCIECGFCEAVCPSKNLSLTPRQRIAVQREIARLKATGENPRRLSRLAKDYRYLGEKTCAADGLCAVSCPVEIDTGAHTRHLRRLLAERPLKQKTADWVAGNYHHATALVAAGLKLGELTHGLLGNDAMGRLTRAARRLSGHQLPAWTPYMPRAVRAARMPRTGSGKARKVVYFPSCINMAMGPAPGDPDGMQLNRLIPKVLGRAGFGVILPPERGVYCCGTAFESKGFFRQAERMARELEGMLLSASQNGRHPILCDTGPCVQRMRQRLDPRLRIYDPFEFIQRYLLDHLALQPCQETIAVHITCSSRRMGLEGVFREVAGVLAAEALFPEDISCCGWAGDRGFHFPELAASALASLQPALQGRCSAGYTNSRTCEIGLSQHSGIYYKSIFYLLERCSRKGS
jgi:D-lactate dehydrogenase